MIHLQLGKNVNFRDKVEIKKKYLNNFFFKSAINRCVLSNAGEPVLDSCVELRSVK